ncbi:ABC transporter substrate-binding protein [Janibacter sp. FSL W8-0316]|uniref:ABC transporter substrate-binding protein n=1 Tax=Janibacter sp. FSL W8-0316 TaxID=2975325 RepID=UPI0030F4E9A5
MRATRSLPLALTLTLALTACGGSALSDGGGGGGDDDSVKIALLVPQSGVYAPLGKDMEAGFRLYLDQHDNQLGGKKVELTVVDEGGGPEDGVPAGTKLAQDESVDAVVGVVNSATALGLVDTFAEAKKPLIIGNAGADDITGKESSPYVWRTSFANGEVGAAIGEKVAEEVGDGKVYLVGPDYAAGKEFLAGFKSSFEKAGGKIAGTQMTPFGKTTNFQPYLQKVRNAKPKAVFAFYAGSEAVTFVKQYDQLGLHKDIPFYGTGFLTEGGALTAQGKSADGIFTSLHYSSELDNETNAAFVKDYSAKNDGKPTVYSVQAYDAGAVLDKALEEGTGGDQIVEGLKAAGEIDSPRGPWSFSDEQGPDQTYYLRKVEQKDGAWSNVVEGDLTKPTS